MCRVWHLVGGAFKYLSQCKEWRAEDAEEKRLVLQTVQARSFYCSGCVVVSDSVDRLEG